MSSSLCPNAFNILIALCYDNALYCGPDAWPGQHEHQQLQSGLQLGCKGVSFPHVPVLTSRINIMPSALASSC